MAYLPESFFEFRFVRSCWGIVWTRFLQCVVVVNSVGGGLRINEYRDLAVYL